MLKLLASSCQDGAGLYVYIKRRAQFQFQSVWACAHSLMSLFDSSVFRALTLSLAAGDKRS